MENSYTKFLLDFIFPHGDIVTDITIGRTPFCFTYVEAYSEKLGKLTIVDHGRSEDKTQPHLYETKEIVKLEDIKVKICEFEKTKTPTPVLEAIDINSFSINNDGQVCANGIPQPIFSEFAKRVSRQLNLERWNQETQTNSK